MCNDPVYHDLGISYQQSESRLLNPPERGPKVERLMDERKALRARVVEIEGELEEMGYIL